jgi:DNA-binding GntR family transcriptional regulator
MVLQDLCDAIRNEIVTRKFPPGMKLTEQMLGNRWEVSRTPIREALRRLESEGFITSNRNKGFVVTTISLRDVEQTYTIMINLDSLAGRLATPFIAADPAKVERLRALCEEMRILRERGNTEGYMEKNWEFHSYIFRSSANPWLIRILENIHAHTFRFILKTLYIPRRMDKSVQEHLKILKYIEKGDAKGAEKAIASHFTKAVTDLKAELTATGGGRDEALSPPAPAPAGRKKKR